MKQAIFVTVIIIVASVYAGKQTQVAGATAQETSARSAFQCQVISASRTEKVEGGFFSWTAKSPNAATGVILLVKLIYPPQTKELLSGDLMLQYRLGSQIEKSPLLGFNPRAPSENRSADQDKLFWILHADSTYKIPLEGEGFDGVIGEEQMRFLLQVPNEITEASLLYQGTACGNPARIPKR